ncbi:hypothetical protein BH09PSE4_BH09PSE4_00940 [soil metagenome]
MDIKRLQQRLADAGFYHRPVDGVIGRNTYAALFGYVAKVELGDKGVAIGDGCAAYFGAAGINTELRIAHFLAQTATETGAFKNLEENLNYTAKGMMACWPSRFPTVESTKGYVMNPKPLALKVYSDRLGNGPAASGDGWDYRGRGLIQLTGRANYAARSGETGMPLEDMPELASDPRSAVHIACLYRTSRKINLPADADDIAKARKAVNGGAIGLDDAKAYLARAKKVLL